MQIEFTISSYMLSSLSLWYRYHFEFISHMCSLAWFWSIFEQGSIWNESIPHFQVVALSLAFYAINTTSGWCHSSVDLFAHLLTSRLCALVQMRYLCKFIFRKDIIAAFSLCLSSLFFMHLYLYVYINVWISICPIVSACKVLKLDIQKFSGSTHTLHSLNNFFRS